MQSSPFLRSIYRLTLLALFCIAGFMGYRLWHGTAVPLTIEGQQRKAQLLPDSTAVRLEVVAEGLRNPWGMAFLPDGRILVTEKYGAIRVIQNDILRADAILGLPPVYNKGQGGLLDIEIHPNFIENNLLFLSFAKPGSNGGNTAILRARLDGTALTDKKIIYEAEPKTSSGRHFGSRLVFDERQRLLFTIGDRGERDKNPQDLSRDGGKVYRIHIDGSIPDDNPFVTIPEARKAIYSFGHRNPQGLTLHPENNTLWLHEHGPRGGDELNIVRAGKNYGWPIVSYGINYDGSILTELQEKAGVEQPETFWTPSIAPCGMTFVTSDRYPEWHGDIILGSLKFDYLVRVNLEETKIVSQHILARDIGRVRNVKEGPDGYIYVAIEGKGLYRLSIAK